MAEKGLTLLQWKLLTWMAKPYGPGAEPSSFRSFRLANGKPRFQEDLTREAQQCALAFIRRGWTSEPDQWGNIRLNEAGISASRAIARPEWQPPAPPKLSDKDFDVLNELASAGREWLTPMQCGGTNSSHHSLSLTKLTHHGFASCSTSYEGGVTGPAIVPQPRLSPRAKGSRRFQATEAGVDAARLWRERKYGS